MEKIAIAVNNIGKLYHIGSSKAEPPANSSIYHKLKAALSVQRQNKQFWALREVSFRIRHGEVVGILGCNGAGKSTLLKILSRVTEPTEGEARIWGRVGSLLEVKTGFHPELTGRENIFLKGSIMGMPKSEIKKKFEDIIDFSEIGDLLDTPVKRYSSGMYVRLAFSVAASLLPEILMIDEVLAVGDVNFRKKCLKRMEQIVQSGCTILLVSHNLEEVQSIARRSLWIDAGKLKMDGPTKNVIQAYAMAAETRLAGGRQE